MRAVISRAYAITPFAYEQNFDDVEAGKMLVVHHHDVFGAAHLGDAVNREAGRPIERNAQIEKNQRDNRVRTVPEIPRHRKCLPGKPAWPHPAGDAGLATKPVFLFVAGANLAGNVTEEAEIPDDADRSR